MIRENHRLHEERAGIFDCLLHGSMCERIGTVKSTERRSDEEINEFRITGCVFGGFIPLFGVRHNEDSPRRGCCAESGNHP